jgi:hypothetical protein
MIVNIPIMTRLNISAGPNLRLYSARVEARKAREIVPRIPATKEPIAERPRAVPALPCLASWWPSIAVTTEEDSPGTLTRIEVVEPPYIAP